jgi:hypothetical protein
MARFIARITGLPNKPLRLTPDAFLLPPGCKGDCQQGRYPCHTPVQCGHALSDDAFAELIVMYFGIAIAIGLVAALMLGWL